MGPFCEGLARETKKGVQTYSMLDNKVSPSQERCWLSNRVQLLETKVTALWLWEGQESMARLWPTSEFNKNVQTESEKYDYLHLSSQQRK